LRLGFGASTITVLYTDKFKKASSFKKMMAKVLADAYGDEMDDWQGQLVELVVREQEYGGETFPVIRFKVPKTQKK
jgi:hypothetical protein